MNQIAKTIRHARNRLWVNHLLRSAARGLLVLLTLMLVPAIWVRLWDVDWQPFHLLWFSFLALPWALVQLSRAKITDTAASMEVDERFRLQERISSAWTLRGRQDPMIRKLQVDASVHAESIDLRAEFPIKVPRESRVLAIPLAAFFAVCLWLPPLPSRLETVADAPVVEKTIAKEKAAQVAKILLPEKEDPKKDEIPKPATGFADLQTPLTELGKKIQEEKMTQREVLAALSNQQSKLQEKKERLAKLEQNLSKFKKPTGEERFTQKIRESLSTGQYGTAAESMAALSDQLAGGDLSAMELEQLRGELESLERGLEGNPDLQRSLRDSLAALDEMGSDSGERDLNPEELKRLQQALSQASLELSDLQQLSALQNEMELALSNIDLAKLALCDEIGQCLACGAVCSGTKCEKCGSLAIALGAGLGSGGGHGAGAGMGGGMGGPGRVEAVRQTRTRIRTGR